MKDMYTIDETTTRIKREGEKMVLDLKNAILQIKVPDSLQASKKSPQSKDVPSRPWLLAGSVGVVLGTVGVVDSDDPKWSYVIGALGLAFLALGVSKIKGSNTQKLSPTVNYEEVKSFMIDKCNTLLDEIKAKWDKLMEEQKSLVQNAIQLAKLSEEEKDKSMSYTYYPESLELTTLPLIDALNILSKDGLFLSNAMKVKAEFAATTEREVQESIKKQITEYNKIVL